MSDEYRITSLADFLAVPAEKQEECLRDFGAWLDMAREAGAVGAILSGAFEVPEGSITFETGSFTWIDDGVIGLSALDFRDTDDNSLGKIRATIEFTEATDGN